MSRLLGILRDRGVTYWADEALAAAALVLADRRPQDAATALCASRPVGDGDGRLVAMRERLERCRTRLAETFGPPEWANTVQRARAVPVDEAIVCTLAALRAPDTAD